MLYVYVIYLQNKQIIDQVWLQILNYTKCNGVELLIM